MNVADVSGLCKKHWTAHVQERIAAGIYAPGKTVADESLIAHVNAHREATSIRTLSRLSGCMEDTIGGLYVGKVITAETARKLHAVPVPARPHEAAADEALVNSVGPTRRLRALMAIGWSLNRIAEMPYAPGYNALSRCSRGVCAQRVHASFARQVADLFDELCMMPGPEDLTGRRARLYAKRRGYAPPLAWDEDTIDDPNAEPYQGDHPIRLVDRRRVLAERIADEREYRKRTDEEIAAAWGTSLDALKTAMRRADIARHAPDGTVYEGQRAS